MVTERKHEDNKCRIHWSFNSSASAKVTGFLVGLSDDDFK